MNINDEIRGQVPLPSHKDLLLKKFVNENQIELTWQTSPPDKQKRLVHQFTLETHDGAFFYKIAEKLNEYEKMRADNARMLEALKRARRHGIREDQNNEDHDYVVSEINEAIAQAEGSSNG